jgi:HAL2 family 3'(2'),5'-bisphosphate nucleotidase
LYQHELQVALRAVQAATRVAEAARATIAANTLPKPDGSPVTIADYAAQAAANRILAEAFPGDRVIAEESCAALRGAKSDDALQRISQLVADVIGVPVGRGDGDGDAAQWIDFGSQVATDSRRRFWTLDPIDGTRGYIEGGHYCPALALVENGLVIVGVLGCPTVSPSASIYYAVRGEGAFVAPLYAPFDAPPDSRKLSVSSQSNGAMARLCQRRTADQAAPTIVALRKRLGMSGPILSADSQVKYAAIAQGDADLYIRPRKHPAHRDKIWDHAAGAILVEEAGGRVTDLAGRPLDFSHGPELTLNNGILATNKALHEQVLDSFSSILPASLELHSKP